MLLRGERSMVYKYVIYIDTGPNKPLGTKNLLVSGTSINVYQVIGLVPRHILNCHNHLRKAQTIEPHLVTKNIKSYGHEDRLHSKGWKMTFLKATVQERERGDKREGRVVRPSRRPLPCGYHGQHSTFTYYHQWYCSYYSYYYRSYYGVLFQINIYSTFVLLYCVPLS